MANLSKLFWCRNLVKITIRENRLCRMTEMSEACDSSDSDGTIILIESDDNK